MKKETNRSITFPSQEKKGNSLAGSIKLFYGFHPTPFGSCLLAVTEQTPDKPPVICHLAFIPDIPDSSNNQKQNEAALRVLSQLWPNATLTREEFETRNLALALFEEKQGQAKKVFRLLLKGSSFQLKVWQAVLAIPPGTTVSYTEIAQAISQPNAVRAVAKAIAANTIAYLVPCHRVIRKSGEISGYRWGPPLKQALLAYERPSPQSVIHASPVIPAQVEIQSVQDHTLIFPHANKRKTRCFGS